MKTFIRWFIFYPITLPIMFIYGVPTSAVFLLWEWIEEKRGKGFDSRGSKAMRRYGTIIAKPYFLLTKIDEKLDTNGKRYREIN